MSALMWIIEDCKQYNSKKKKKRCVVNFEFRSASFLAPKNFSSSKILYFIFATVDCKSILQSLLCYFNRGCVCCQHFTGVLEIFVTVNTGTGLRRSVSQAAEYKSFHALLLCGVCGGALHRASLHLARQKNISKKVECQVFYMFLCGC